MVSLFRNRRSKMRSSPPAPQPSQLPYGHPPPPVHDSSRPYPPTQPPDPPLYLQLGPLQHPGAAHLLATCPDIIESLASARDSIFALLYPHTGFVPPRIHRVTIIVEAMEGVAHTCGGAQDGWKEIHLSADYIREKPASEIYGVLLHELVHVWQHNGHDTLNFGWQEGIADFVRLRGGLGAEHWEKARPGPDDTWDAGYERTAYFFDWIDTSVAPGGMARVNARLRNERWGAWVWNEWGAPGVENLWEGYKRSFEESRYDGPPVPPARPTHAAY